MKLTVWVTMADIAIGQQGALGCPMALAINRALADAGRAELMASVNPYYSTGISIGRRCDYRDRSSFNDLFRLRFPEKGREWVMDFDAWNWRNIAGQPNLSLPAPLAFALNLAEEES